MQQDNKIKEARDNFINNRKDVKRLNVPATRGAATDSLLSTKQRNALGRSTALHHIKFRPGAGGKVFTYVTGDYMRNMMNYVFGSNWSFEITAREIVGADIIVQGRITARVGDQTLIKDQFGGAKIKLGKYDKKPVDLGNDMKAAATDCFKKCASQFGIAGDVYGSGENTEIQYVDADTIAEEKANQEMIGWLCVFPPSETTMAH